MVTEDNHQLSLEHDANSRKKRGGKSDRARYPRACPASVVYSNKVLRGGTNLCRAPILEAGG